MTGERKPGEAMPRTAHHVMPGEFDRLGGRWTVRHEPVQLPGGRWTVRHVPVRVPR